MSEDLPDGFLLRGDARVLRNKGGRLFYIFFSPFKVAGAFPAFVSGCLRVFLALSSNFPSHIAVGLALSVQGGEGVVWKVYVLVIMK